jgi:hypothetical protein
MALLRRKRKDSTEIEESEDACPGGLTHHSDTGEPFMRPTFANEDLVNDQLEAIRPPRRLKRELYALDREVGVLGSEMVPNYRYRQVKDIRMARRFLRRKHVMTPFLVIANALARAGITTEDRKEAFRPGRPSKERKALRDHIRAMVLSTGVDGVLWAKYLGVSRVKLSGLLNETPSK